MFNRCGRRRVVRVGLKILYRNSRRPGEAGMKLIPNQSQREAEKKILKGLGFTIIEITSGASARASPPHGPLPRT
jgi:hypothetical protein